MYVGTLRGGWHRVAYWTEDDGTQVVYSVPFAFVENPEWRIKRRRNLGSIYVSPQHYVWERRWKQFTLIRANQQKDLLTRGFQLMSAGAGHHYLWSTQADVKAVWYECHQCKTRLLEYLFSNSVLQCPYCFRLNFKPSEYCANCEVGKWDFFDLCYFAAARDWYEGWVSNPVTNYAGVMVNMRKAYPFQYKADVRFNRPYLYCPAKCEDPVNYCEDECRALGPFIDTLILRCPLCRISFSADELQVHSALCTQ